MASEMETRTWYEKEASFLVLINTKVFHYNRKRALKAGSLQCERDGQEDVRVRSGVHMSP